MRTKYSDKIDGVAGNYYWKVDFDLTSGGFLGINQFDENGKITNRILLSKKQTEKLIEFVKPKSKPAKKTSTK